MANYYDEMADGYDALHGEEQIKKYSLIKKSLDISSHETILDIGHGSGVIAAVFEENDITGIDNSEKLLEKSRCRTINWDFNDLPLPFEDDSFDTVLCVTAFHHSYDFNVLAKEIKRIARSKVAVSLLKKSPSIEEQKNALKSIFESAEFENIGIDILMTVLL